MATPFIKAMFHRVHLRLATCFPSSSGDLSVEVKESDGSINSYSVPYSTVPVLQREGRVKYALTAAEYRSSSDQQDEVNFVQGSQSGSFRMLHAVHSGSQITNNYHSLAFGTGLNMGELGAALRM
jgi:outer membrane usher protein